MQSSVMVMPQQSALASRQSGVSKASRSSQPTKRSTQVSREDWERARPLIKRLYVDEDRTWKEVMAFVEKKYCFGATPNMYQTRFRKWGFEKNFSQKEREMAALLRMKLQRDEIGKQSVLKIRGRTVDFEEVLNYFRQKGIPLDKVPARHVGAATPPGISCTAPEFFPRITLDVPHSPSTPHSLVVPEQLLFNIDQYMSVHFSNRTWVALEDGSCVNPASVGDVDFGRMFYDHGNTSAHLFHKKLFVDGRRALSKACGLVRGLLKAEGPRTVEYLLDVFLNLIKNGVPEIVTQLCFYISRMAGVLLDANHPWGRICRLLGSIEPDRTNETLLQCMNCTSQVYAQFLGPLHERTVVSDLCLIEYGNGINDLVETDRRYQRMDSRCREAGILGKPLWLTNMCHFGIWYKQSRYAEAESLACGLFDGAREAGDHRWQILALDWISKAQFKQGKTHLAERTMMDAVDLLRRKYDGSDSWALSTMVHYRTSLQELGLEQRASELGPEIERRMLLAKVDDDDVEL